MNILFLRVRLNEYTLPTFRPTTEKYAQSHQTVLSLPGGREPSGDSGQNVLSVRNVIILLTTWIITHNLNRTVV